MITIEQMRLELSEIRLMLGGVPWNVRIETHKYEGPFLCFTAITEDSFKPGENVELRINSQVLDVVRADEETFKEWVFQRWLKICLHEAMEGFQFAGEVFRNPHEAPETYFIKENAA